jgi:predicted ATPase/DNA-binding winged helix-turn-helix (wHTH) protein
LPAAVPTLRFGDFELRPAERRLLRSGAPVALGARAIDLLIALASHRGRLLTKQQLLDIVWPDVVVEEANLHVQMSALRKVLGPDTITTVPGRGYQFVATLADSGAGVDAPIESAESALPQLVGRAVELAAIDAALDRHALVSIVGTGGIGKTALARHVAHLRRARQRHGVAWIDLHDITEPQSLPGVVATALDLKLHQATPHALAEAASALDLLLVLDNGEHLGNVLAPLCDSLLAGAPQLRLLVTSQAPLQLFGEHVLRLSGLAVPMLPSTLDDALRHGAVALFVARAQDVDRRFRLDADTLDDVVTICRALDGSALGVQVAAALLARMPLVAIRQGLGQRLSWPDLQPQTDATGHSRGLRSALAWSLSLLDDTQRELFRRLAAFTGPADMPLMQQALANDTLDAWALVDALAVLVDRSLVAVSADEPPRYQLLETPRALAAEDLALRGDVARWRERVFRAVGARAKVLAVWERGEGGHQQRQHAHLPDLTPAFEWARAHDIHLALSLGEVLPLPPLASVRIAHAAVMKALGEAPGLSLQQRGRAWFNAGGLLVHARPSEAQGLTERAAAAFVATSDRVGEYLAWCRLADIVSTPADVAQAALQRAAALEQPDWPPGRLGWRARAEGAAANLLGDRPRAIAAYRRAVALHEAAGTYVPASLISLADAELADGQVEAASRHLMAVIERLRDGRHDTALYGFAMPNLVAAALARDQLPLARRTAAEGWPQAGRVGAEAWWADHLALLAALEGRHRTAAGLLGLADVCYATANDQRQALEARHAERAAALALAALGDAAFEALRARVEDPAAAALLRQAALSPEDQTD